MEGLPRTLAGRYELSEVIGRGGMGTVYRARDVALDRTVAVKVLAAALAEQDPANVARFEREAHAAATLNCPAVVAVYDAGVDANVWFIVMEFVDGRSLDVILREEGRVEPGRAADISARVADALAAAHAAGIVHRDIKPANVMVAAGGEVKVMDFGIARVADASTLTRNASVLGTAAYMAPEQARGEPADERSDIYSLGCVVYALLTGHPPFSGDNAAAMLHQHASVAPRPPREENPAISPALDSVVMQMLAKSPHDRPQSAAQVRARLMNVSDGGGAVPSVTAPTVAMERTAVTRPLAGVSRRSRRRLTLVVAGAVVAGVIAAVAVAAGGGSSPPAPTTHHAPTAAATDTAQSAPTNTGPQSTTTTTTTTPPTGPPSSATGPPDKGHGHGKKNGEGKQPPGHENHGHKGG